MAAHVVPLGAEAVPIASAAGRVLAEALRARTAMPRVAVSVMDGYAVIDASTKPDEPQTVVGESRAGAAFPHRIAAGQAVRIFTGAPLPAGADRCIMQEYAVRDGDHVRFVEGYGPSWHVRAAGSDCAAGSVLLAAGQRLTPRAMVAAAAADVAQLTVAHRPTVAIIGTGDELAPPGEASLRPDAIPESVTYGVAALAEQAGARVVSRVAVPDDLPALEGAAGSALSNADVVVVCGGASVGERDFAKPMFAAQGLELLFSRVAIKPGKPVWLGRAKGKWVLGLPGNPVSAMVTARLFLVPLLARLQGQAMSDLLCWRQLPLARPLGPTGDRETFHRARWDEDGIVPLGNQDSGAQSSLTAADWLIRCPAGLAAIEAGQLVTLFAF